MIPMQWQATPPLSVVAEDYHRLAREFGNTREPLRQSVEQVIIPSIQQNFDSDGRPAWAPLTQFTINIARKMDKQDRRPIGAATPILDRLRGAGMSSVVTRMARWRINGRQHIAEFNNLPPTYQYARFHQTGFRWISPKTGWSGTTPARPWALFQNEDISKIQEIFASWIEQKARQR